MHACLTRSYIVNFHRPNGIVTNCGATTRELDPRTEDHVFNSCLHDIYGPAIKFVSEITFLSISIKNNDVTDHNISKTSRKFYHKAD